MCKQQKCVTNIASQSMIFKSLRELFQKQFWLGNIKHAVFQLLY